MLVLYEHRPNSLRPSAKRANVEKKVPQTILASPYTPRQTWGKNAHIWKQHILKRGFPKNQTWVSLSSLWDWNWFLRRTVHPLKPLLATLGRCTLVFTHPRNMSVSQGKTSFEARGPNIYRNSFQKVLLREPFSSIFFRSLKLWKLSRSYWKHSQALHTGQWSEHPNLTRWCLHPIRAVRN